MKYILEGKIPIVESNVIKWGKWYNKDDNRRVARTQIENDEYVSTIFLGLDYSFGDGTPPLLFETMIFGGKYSNDCWRFSTWEQAEVGHNRVVKGLMNGVDMNTEDFYDSVYA